MKSLGVLAALVAVVAVGCGNDNAAQQDMAAPDLAAPAADLSTNDDLSTLTGCHGLELCLLACKGDTACQMTCRMNATTEAKKLAKALNDCRAATCDAGDGGTGPCVAGMPASASCTQCRMDSISAPGTCTGGGMPSWCGACYAEYTACAANLP